MGAGGGRCEADAARVWPSWCRLPLAKRALFEKGNLVCALAKVSKLRGQAEQPHLPNYRNWIALRATLWILLAFVILYLPIHNFHPLFSLPLLLFDTLRYTHERRHHHTIQIPKCLFRVSFSLLLLHYSVPSTRLFTPRKPMRHLPPKACSTKPSSTPKTPTSPTYSPTTTDCTTGTN